MPPHVLRSDGGSRGNPGPAAAAFILEDEGRNVVASGSRFLGRVTNNVAEYEGLLMGLHAAEDAGVRHLEVLLDSELIVRQLNGEYRVKDEKLKPLFAKAVERLDSLEEVVVSHIRREENAQADSLVNQALDAELGVSLESPGSPGGRWELTVKGHFDAAHSLVGYPGECRELHGHTWDVEVTVRGSRLDSVGIVYDFKTLKADLGAVLEPLDHAHLNEVEPFDTLNPTAENLARYICECLEGRVGQGVSVVEVAVWESPIARIVFRPE